MSRAVAWLRDTAAVVATVTTSQGKRWFMMINTDTGRLHVMDGTAGGIPLARLDDVPGAAATVYSTPTTGQTISAASGDQKLQLTPAGTLASLTVELPPSPLDDREYRIATTQTITALTVNGAAGEGATVIGGSGTLPANGSLIFCYRAATTTWHRVG